MIFRLLSFIVASLCCDLSALAAAPVTLTEVDEIIPTYQSGPPDPSPMFYFGRMSQGAEGRTYPYPLYSNLTDQKADQAYHLVYLENEYVKIGIAPQLGGRLFSAVDKTNGYHFVYRQHVIKPALIGLIGAWISGGIEWNIPHHHRATTYLPVQYQTEENADGSKTVWVGELEIRHRMRWAVGYTLHPGSNVLQCSVRILNRTPVVNTMLCFANVAVNTNENYQIIFPPSTQFVTHHFKREFTTWPIATKPYGGVNWDHVDVSWYKNHQAANSMFAWNYSDDFFAGYDHGQEAGTMSIADHHLVPGKKFWTWGNGPRGRMWDNILTDTDGPYIELMVGAYSDNQPDYSWLQPFETRSFEMNWYPFRDIGGVKKANRDAAVNLEIKDGQAQFGFYTTAPHPQATARLTVSGKVLSEDTIAIEPAHPFTRKIALPSGTKEPEVIASLQVDGRELVSYSPLRLPTLEMPEPVKPPGAPQDYKTDEELSLAGQRIDQFHDPDREPEPYWEEVLRRDPANTAAHTGLGLRALRAGRYAEAEQHFRAAIARLTAKYTTPKNAEPLYYLGVALKAQNRSDEAYDAFFKASWSQEWRGPSYFSLAEIASARGDFPTALELVDRSLDANALNVRAYGLKASLLRHLNRPREAGEVLTVAARKTDPLDVRLLAERWLSDREPALGQRLSAVLDAHPSIAQELAAEYGNAGLWQDAVDLLTHALARRDAVKASPLLHYYLADFAERLGQSDRAAAHRKLAAEQSPAYVFPFQAELIPVLRRALEVNPTDAHASYYLGNLLFDWQPEEAIRLWEKATTLDPGFPMTWRNLAQAYAHGKGDDHNARAIAALEKAVALTDTYPTHFAELDTLYAAVATPPEKRLALLEGHQSALLAHDECLARLIGLKTFAGKTDEAIGLLEHHTFNIWEGGTRFNAGDSWIDAHLARGIQRLKTKQPSEALADFELASKFPTNLRAYDTGSRTAETAYWIGVASEAVGDRTKAQAAWERATTAKPETGRRAVSDSETSGEAFRRAAQRYYEALAWQKLGQKEKAETTFRELTQKAQAKPNTNSETSAANLSGAEHYRAGLGYAGLGEKEKARAELMATLSAAPDNLGAKLALNQL